jgi:hypothetical protein
MPLSKVRLKKNILGTVLKTAVLRALGVPVLSAPAFRISINSPQDSSPRDHEILRSFVESSEGNYRFYDFCVWKYIYSWKYL